MAKYASKVVEQAKAWLGRNEKDGTHKYIIDVYNSHKPLARGYAVQYNDQWCATTVSAVAIALGYTDIIPTECSCSKMIELLKQLGAWNESDNRTPNPGDLIFYDWQDSKPETDNRNSPDHVGIVEKVSNGKITVIEGNYSKSVKRRTLDVNGKYIRGYGVPKYDAEQPSVEQPTAPIVTTKTIDELAADVIDGKYGSGEARKAALGDLYDEVQTRVNELLKPKTTEVVHTVVTGDTLWEIAKKHLGNGGRYPEIMKLNGLTSTVIHRNQKLKIPKK